MGSLLTTRLHSRNSTHHGLATYVQLAVKTVAAEAASSVAIAGTVLRNTLIFSEPTLTDGQTTGIHSMTVAGTVVEPIRLTLAKR